MLYTFKLIEAPSIWLSDFRVVQDFPSFDISNMYFTVTHPLESPFFYTFIYSIIIIYTIHLGNWNSRSLNHTFEIISLLVSSDAFQHRLVFHGGLDTHVGWLSRLQYWAGGYSIWKYIRAFDLMST